MENNTKRREWVKSAAIVFLTILLLLTFFSNTISKRFLPEVSSVAVTDGSITAKVRASGKVTARGNNNVKAEGTRTIAAVKVKEGQEVNEGDILFVMGEAASDELEAAETARDSAYYSYRRAQASYPTGTSSASYNAAYNSYLRACDAANSAWAEYNAAVQRMSDPAYAELEARLTIENATLADLENQLAAHQNELFADKEAKQVNYQIVYSQWLNATEEERIAYLDAELAFSQSEYEWACTEYENSFTMIDSYYAAVVGQQSVISAIMTEISYYSTDLSMYRTKAESADAALANAESMLQSAEASYAMSAAADGQSYALASITEEEAANTYSKAQEKVDNLTGVGEDIYVKAKVSGTVESINFSAGDKVVKDDVMCVIEVPDMGYQMTCSVTKDQAGRLKVGDTASASNYYWGKEILATISSIKTDPSSPQAKKIITFDIEGDVTAGQELTFSVGQKSASYDIIVPKSAVMSDNNGSFVLTITSKSNALGNRYFAKRVGVEILAEDDTYKAISGDLGYGDFVITGSSTKISSGDQVRLADNG